MLKTSDLISQESIEFKLAVKQIYKLDRQGFGSTACIQSAAKLVESQGFGKAYAKEVAQYAYEFV